MSTEERWTLPSQGLGRTLLFWFLLLMVTSFVIAGIIVATISYQNVSRAAMDRLSAIATLKESEINAWVVGQQAELALMSTPPEVRSKLLYVLSAETQDALVAATRDKLQQFLAALTPGDSSFEELFLLDIHGRVLLSSDPSQIGASHARQAYFIRGQEAPYLHPPYYSLYTAAPSIVVAQPIQDNMGRTWGVLAGRLNVDQMNNIMNEEAGLGETGETYLINGAGRILVPPRSGGELVLGQEMRTEGVSRGLGLDLPNSKERMGWSRYANYRGQQVFGVYRWLPTLQVVLLAEQETGEIMASTRNILLISLAILLGMAVAAAATALLVSQRITRPLVALTKSADLLAAGDLSQGMESLSHQVPYIERHAAREIRQLAWAFAKMSQQLRQLITSLEEQVTERTRQWQEANYKLQRRAIQLESIALVGQAITSILSLDDLLLEMVNLIRARFNFYHAGIFLLDRSGEWAVLRQATGEAGQRMLARKHRLAVGGQSIVGWVTAQRQPRVALDVGTDAVHFKNPDLPHTRSEMALPLVVGDRLLGALDVQSTEEAAFDEEDVAILSLMADQVAVAINNALKFSQEAAVLEATSPLYRASRHIALATSLDGVLRGILDHAAGPYVDRCSINLYASATDEEPQGVSGWVEVAALWDRAADPPDPSGTRYPLPAGGETERDAHMPRRRGGEPAGAQSLMNDLRRERAEPLVVDDLLAKVVDHRVDSETGSLLSEKLGLRAALILPMVAGGQTSGWLMVASRQPHAWTEAEVRTFRSLTDQAAVAVQHVRLFQETQTRAAREQVIRQITEQLWRAVDVESILQTAVSKLGQATRAPRVYVRLGTEEISNGK